MKFITDEHKREYNEKMDQLLHEYLEECRKHGDNIPFYERDGIYLAYLEKTAKAKQELEKKYRKKIRIRGTPRDYMTNKDILLAAIAIPTVLLVFIAIMGIVALLSSWGAYSMYTHEQIRWTHEISGLHGCIIGLGVEIFRMLSALVYWITPFVFYGIGGSALFCSTSQDRLPPILSLMLFVYLFLFAAPPFLHFFFEVHGKIEEASWWDFFIDSLQRGVGLCSSSLLLLSIHYLILSVIYYFDDST